MPFRKREGFFYIKYFILFLSKTSHSQLTRVMKSRKSTTRWIGEAILIFASIMAAFYIENYREQRTKEKIYINHLKDFYLDLQINQERLNFDLKKPNGTIDETLQIYDSLKTLLTTKKLEDIPQTIKVLKNAERYSAKWFFQSPHLDRLMIDYYSFIKNAELKKTMRIHKRRMSFINTEKDDIKKETKKLHIFYDQLNLKDSNNYHNQQVLSNKELFNQVSRLEELVGKLRLQYYYTKTRDSLICIEINKELSLLGVSN